MQGFAKVAGSVLIAVAISLVIDEVVTVEWSYPGCDDPWDGPGAAAFGFPAPYLRWGVVSSLEYFFAPHLFLLNIAVIAALLWPMAWALWPRMSDRMQWVAALLALAVTGTRAVCIIALLTVFGWNVTWRTPWTGAAYNDLRPVRVVWSSPSPEYFCTPSPYWFGPPPPPNSK